MSQPAIYSQLTVKIIQYQESIIGPVAWNQAKEVPGLEVHGTSVELQGNGKKILESLVRQFEKLFGQASVEACKDAIRPLLSKVGDIDLPQNLR